MSSKAIVRKPAPNFAGQAVVGDQFKEIKLSDYKVRAVRNVECSCQPSFPCFVKTVSLRAELDHWLTCIVLQGKWLVLAFYPCLPWLMLLLFIVVEAIQHCSYALAVDFTFVCPTEIIAFSEKAADFQKIGMSQVVTC